jgi:hypothetical protein
MYDERHQPLTRCDSSATRVYTATQVRSKWWYHRYVRKFDEIRLPTNDRDARHTNPNVGSRTWRYQQLRQKAVTQLRNLPSVEEGEAFRVVTSRGIVKVSHGAVHLAPLSAHDLEAGRNGLLGCSVSGCILEIC